MRLPRHVAGFIVFIMILTCAEVINYYVSRLSRKAAPAKIAAPAPKTPPEMPAEVPPVNYNVRLVSLDFINGKSHATLTFKHKAGDPAPDWLWVTTIFLSPESDKIWVTKTEVRNPFGAGTGLNLPGTYEVTATAPCPWCDLPGPPASGDFARVYVSANVNQFPTAEALDPDIRAAVPVLVQARREPRR